MNNRAEKLSNMTQEEFRKYCMNELNKIPSNSPLREFMERFLDFYLGEESKLKREILGEAN